LVSHPGDFDEPEGGQSLGGRPAGETSGSVKKDGDGDEGEIQEETAQSLKCDDCQRLFRDGKVNYYKRFQNYFNFIFYNL